MDSWNTLKVPLLDPVLHQRRINSLQPPQRLTSILRPRRLRPRTSLRKRNGLEKVQDLQSRFIFEVVFRRAGKAFKGCDPCREIDLLDLEVLGHCRDERLPVCGGGVDDVEGYAGLVFLSAASCLDDVGDYFGGDILKAQDVRCIR